MLDPKTPQQLAQAIETLVAAYCEEGRRLAQMTLDQAFAKQAKNTKRVAKPNRARSESGAEQKWCSSEETAERKERLYDLIAGRPGISMTELCEEMGLPKTTMRRPMRALCSEGRIRSVGERNMTRYFPGLGRRSSKNADE